MKYDTKQTLELVKTSGRTNKSPQPRILNTEAKWPIGKYIRHGDVMIRRVPLKKISGKKASLKLAPGNTVGSNHTVEERSDMQVVARDGDILVGPEMYCPTGFTLNHPTHARFEVSLPGNYEVSYPQDLASVERRRRAD